MDELEDETLEVVALSEGGAVEDTFCEGGDVDAGEGVWGAGVAAHGEETGVLASIFEDVEEEAEGDG